jgi:hypothetical protein
VVLQPSAAAQDWALIQSAQEAFRISAAAHSSRWAPAVFREHWLAMKGEPLLFAA